MSVRRVLAIAAVTATLSLVVVAPAEARQPAKTLVFNVALQSAGTDTYDLPNDVNYGQGRLVGTTTWGRRAASVDWMCSHISTGGSGPANDLITITRSDGAVLALAITGWVASGTLRGSVEVIGGKGAYRGATGNGTVVGRAGNATLSINVTQGGSRALPRHGIGC